MSELVRTHIFGKDLARPVIGDEMFPATDVKLTKCIVRALKPLRELNPALEDREAFDEVCGICTCILLTVLTLHEPGACPQLKSLGHLSFHAG